MVCTRYECRELICKFETIVRCYYQAEREVFKKSFIFLVTHKLDATGKYDGAFQPCHACHLSSGKTLSCEISKRTWNNWSLLKSTM